ncbi:hypothetical protein [Streptomyces tibetensis]|uniref:hypothetical protein n=1 Tax=Streptomyces tibetensis TaxID=2382123 RepID=UPI003F4D5A55
MTGLGRTSWDAWPVTGTLGVAGLLALHSAVPDGVGRLGSLLETFLPWLGSAVPLLACLAARRRSVPGLLACLTPAVVPVASSADTSVSLTPRPSTWSVLATGRPAG